MSTSRSYPEHLLKNLIKILQIFIEYRPSFYTDTLVSLSYPMPTFSTNSLGLFSKGNDPNIAVKKGVKDHKADSIMASL